MKASTAGMALRAGILFAPLALVACGGGGDGPSTCNNPNPAVCAAVGSASTSAAATNNTTATSPNAGTLFSTAPSAVTLNAGSSATYTVGGGTPPYTTTSGNTNVGNASISGTTLSVSGIAAGTSPIVVVDAVGKTVNIALTVLAQGQAGSALSVAPGALTVGDCTTNIPFIFSGGVAPYTIFTSDNFSVPVSSPLPLAEKSYFTATVKALGALPPYVATLTVLDSQSRTATATITVPVGHASCPNNPKLAVLPESANFRASEVLAFQIAGGDSTVAPSVTFMDDSVATVLSRTPTTVTIQASFPVTIPKTTLMTITSNDGQKANIVITVLPQTVPKT